MSSYIVWLSLIVPVMQIIPGGLLQLCKGHLLIDHKIVGIRINMMCVEYDMILELSWKVVNLIVSWTHKISNGRYVMNLSLESYNKE